MQLTSLLYCTEMVQGQDEGEGQQPSFVRPGESPKGCLRYARVLLTECMFNFV